VQASPYAAPKAQVDDAAPGAPASIWNPNATANWSLIFTPAFGAYLQMLNWRSLGEPGRAATAKGWFIAGLALLLVYVLMGVLLPNEQVADAGARGLGFVFLIVWYFAAGRRQSNFVKERWGKDYPRKGWGRPLFYGVAALAGYYALAFAIGLGIGLARNALR